MSHPSSPSERLEHALANPSGGVLGLVDELLAVSSEQGVQLDWREGLCRVTFPDGGPSDRIEVPLRKSVVRAVLARVASLCNERCPDSVSPYGGRGEVAIDADPPKAVQVVFVNTPEEQSLDLAPIRPAERRPPRGQPASTERRGSRSRHRA
jgi:hypothetical protein